MTPFARAALVAHPGQLGAGAPPRPPLELSDSVRGKCEVDGLRELVQTLLDRKLVLGCQVSVIQQGKTLVELCAGARDPYSLRPVQADTVFNAFSVSKAVTAAAVHLLAQRGAIDLDASVATYWPAFQNKSDITVRHVLNHQAGLADAGSAEMGRDPFMACDSDAMLSLLAAATPAAPPGGAPKYHYLTFGWLVEGIVRGATGRSLAEVVEEEITRPLGICDEMLMGLGAGGAEVRKDQLAELTLRRSSENISGAPEAVPEEGDDEEGGVVAGGGGVRSAGENGEEAGGVEADQGKQQKRRPIEGGMLLMNPTFFNNKRIREASIPAANGHFSARALARFYWALVDPSAQGLFDSPLSQDGGGGAGGPRMGQGGEAVTIQREAMLQGGGSTFSNGFALYPTAQEGRVMVGHAGILFDPPLHVCAALHTHRAERAIPRVLPTVGALLLPTAVSKSAGKDGQSPEAPWSPGRDRREHCAVRPCKWDVYSHHPQQAFDGFGQHVGRDTAAHLCCAGPSVPTALCTQGLRRA